MKHNFIKYIPLILALTAYLTVSNMSYNDDINSTKVEIEK